VEPRPRPRFDPAARSGGSERPTQQQRAQRRERAVVRSEIRRERAAAMQRHPSGQPTTRTRVTPPAYVHPMDDHAHLPTGTDDLATARATAQGRAAPPGAPTPAEPSAAQPALPFDEAADRPIPFSLTARARRVVAPQALPPLTVVPSGPRRAARGWNGTLAPRPARDRDEGPGAAELPGDTRPARARALRRAGVGTAAIARKLAVDELLVLAWVGDAVVAPTAATAAPSTTEPAPDHEETTGFALARAAAADEARELVRTDAAFAAGLGLVAAVVATDTHAATFATTRLELAARIIVWLRDRAGVEPGSLRVVLRLGAGAAGDLARHRWAETLGVPVTGVVHTRWHGAPAPDAVEALVRIPDPATAATLAGWCDALLDPTGGGSADPAF
jgi:hypothetical protein